MLRHGSAKLLNSFAHLLLPTSNAFGWPYPSLIRLRQSAEANPYHLVHIHAMAACIFSWLHFVTASLPSFAFNSCSTVLLYLLY